MIHRPLVRGGRGGRGPMTGPSSCSAGPHCGPWPCRISTDHDAVDYVQGRLRRLGVERALVRAGVRDGDVVHLGAAELHLPARGGDRRRRWSPPPPPEDETGRPTQRSGPTGTRDDRRRGAPARWWRRSGPRRSRAPAAAWTPSPSTGCARRWPRSAASATASSW